MKLAKLSLAALIALGAYSSMSAEALEDVIKNVDMSGYLKYQYDNTTKKVDDTKKNAEANHSFKSQVNFKSAIDDNFFTVISLKYSTTSTSGYLLDKEKEKSKKMEITGTSATTNTSTPLNVREAYLGYKVGNTTILAGRQTVNSFFTDDMLGVGIVASNSDIAGLTLSTFAFDNLEADGDIGQVDKDNKIQLKPDNSYTYQHNLFGLAIQGAYDPVNFQFWAAKLKNVANLFALETGVDFGEFGAKFQAGASAINKGFKKQTFTVDSKIVEPGNGFIFGGEGTMNVAGFDGSLGGVYFGAKKDKVSLVSFEDKGGFISAGEQAPFNYNMFQGKNIFGYLTAGYTFGDMRVGGDLVYGVSKTVLDEDSGGKEYSHSKTTNTEGVLRFEYAYSKKLNFSSYYSVLKTKKDTVVNSSKTETDSKTTSDQFKFTVKYSF